MPTASKNLRTRNRTPFTESFSDDGPIIALLLGIVFLMGEEVHLFEHYRLLFVIVGTLLLTFSAISFFQKSCGTRLRLTVMLPLVLLVVWSIVTIRWAEFQSPAIADLLRLLSGVAAFIIGAFCLKSSRLPLTVLGLIGLIVLVAGVSLGSWAGKHSSTASLSFYATHEEVGTLILMGWPLAMAFALTPGVPERWRQTGLVGALILVMALIVDSSRSAWVGSAGATIALVGLMALYKRPGLSPEQKKKLNPVRRPATGVLAQVFSTPLPFLALGLILLPVILLRVGPITHLRYRLVSLVSLSRLGMSEEDERLIRWDAAARMAIERPWRGWGLGAYPPLQARWSHRGIDTVVALSHGIDHRNIAHNYYVQTAAETGGVGLTLNIMALTAALLLLGGGIRGMVVTRSEGSIRVREARALRCAVAVGATAAICGAVIDALGSPSYQFPALFGILWALVGIGIAAVEPDGESGTVIKPIPFRRFAMALGVGVMVGLVVTGGVLAFGHSRVKRGTGIPLGRFYLESSKDMVHLLEPSRDTVHPGDTLTITAHFTQGDGKPCWTEPGTEWSLSSEDASFAAETQLTLQSITTKDGVYLSLISLRVPPTISPVTISARYRDAYNRTYRAQTVITVRPTLTPLSTGIKSTTGAKD